MRKKGSTYTVHKMGFILRSIERIPKMQFSMSCFRHYVDITKSVPKKTHKRKIIVCRKLYNSTHCAIPTYGTKF